MLKNLPIISLLAVAVSACSTSTGKDIASTTPSSKVSSTKTMVHFAFDSAELTKVAKQRLIKEAHEQKMRSTSILVEGHCDKVGTDEYNHALGLRRAKAVSFFLIKQGVPSQCIQSISFGKRLAISSNHAENRKGVVVDQGGYCSPYYY